MDRKEGEERSVEEQVNVMSKIMYTYLHSQVMWEEINSFLSSHTAQNEANTHITNLQL